MMVLDLWGPPCTEDANESGDNMLPVWQCGAFPVDGVDSLEEDAVNETCCVQVLKLLLSQADEEIGELENYLQSLQSELKWAEIEEWSDIFVSALQEKIDHLNISVKSMKSAIQEDDKSYLGLSREPAEDMYEVLKKLLAGIYERKEQTTNQPSAFTSCKTDVEANDDARHESCLDTKSVDKASDVPLKLPGTESIPDSYEPVGDSIEKNLLDESQQAGIMNGMKEKCDGQLSKHERVDGGSEPISAYVAPIISMHDGIAESKLTIDIVLGSTAFSQNSKVKTEVLQCGSQARDSLRMQIQSSEGASKVKAAVSIGVDIVSPEITQGASHKRKLESVIASPTKARLRSAGNSLKQCEKQLSSLIEVENAGSRKPLAGKILKEVIQSMKSEPGQRKSVVTTDSVLKTVPNLASSAETADVSGGIKHSNSDGESMGSVTDSSCVESQTDERRFSSLAKLNLESLSMVDLKAIAKQRKITKYHALRKSLLVERISNSFGDDCNDRVEIGTCCLADLTYQKACKVSNT
ncbi:hypothetical protein MLD38_028804 [Melastoma candidum]|uniref:Uncharacterized protein n=1 Tax=Melastoma candidum TaxID=119954 RepID=A0ACB9N3P1_9MYRT|nr:hypothetical protein MLD38_028804 [Melastoma candidum]